LRNDCFSGSRRCKTNPRHSIRIRPILAAEGFTLEQTVPGENKFGEDAQYWRKEG